MYVFHVEHFHNLASTFTDSNGVRTHNQLVHPQIQNHLPKLALNGSALL